MTPHAYTLSPNFPSSADNAEAMNPGSSTGKIAVPYHTSYITGGITPGPASSDTLGSGVRASGIKAGASGWINRFGRIMIGKIIT